MFDKVGRRFAKSNGWPSERRRRLLPGKDGWRRVQWSPGPAPIDLERQWDEIPRSGTPEQMVESTKQTLRRLLKVGEQFVYIN